MDGKISSSKSKTIKMIKGRIVTREYIFNLFVGKMIAGNKTKGIMKIKINERLMCFHSVKIQ